MLRQIGKIITKNLKLLVRSRSSALIFVLGPLFLILLVGFAFNSVGTRNVDIGIYSPQYSEVTLSFVKEIAEGPFRTFKFVSEDSCIESIKKGTVSACVIFPAELNVKDTRVDEIMFHVDYSKINIVWQVLDRIKKQLDRASDSFSLDLTNTLLITIDDINSEAHQTYPLLDSAKEQNDALIDQIKVSSGRMSGIRAKINSDEYEFEEVKIEVGTLKHEVGKVYNNMDRLYKKSKEMTSYGLGRALQCAADDEEEDALREELDVSQLGIFKTDADDAYTKAQWKINYTFNVIEELEGGVVDLENQLEKNDNLRKDIQRNLTSTTNLVEVNQQSLDVIKRQVDAIDELAKGIEQRDAENIVTPVATNIRPVIPEKTNLVYLFPNLMTLVAMFICILLAATIVVTEKKSTAYFRNFISPSSDINFIIGSFITNLLVMLVQLGVILFIADYYFRTEIMLNIKTILLILLLLISVFTFIGMFVGFLLRSQDTVTIGAIVVSSIMLFLSDLIMPIESMPVYISNLASYNPFIIGSDLLKKAVLFHKPLDTLMSSVNLLIFYIVLGFGLVCLIQWLFKKQKIGMYANRFALRREKGKRRRVIQFSDDEEF